MDYYKGHIPILDPQTMGDRDYLFPVGAVYGAVPRDYSVDPEEMFATPPSSMKYIEEADWDAWYDEQEAQKSSLEHLYLPDPAGPPRFVNLDQAQEGYCWGYSVGHTLMFDRLKSGSPVPRMNPHSICAIIKGGRNEGGWCGLSGKFVEENGMAEEGTGPGQWPLHSRNLRHDTPELRAAMRKHRITESFMDLSRPVYGQVMTAKQLATCLFLNIPCATDFNWWGHSVCTIRKVRIERGSWGLLILNSWLRWGRFGLGVLRGSQAIPDAAIGIRTTVVPKAA